LSGGAEAQDENNVDDKSEKEIEAGALGVHDESPRGPACFKKRALLVASAGRRRIPNFGKLREDGEGRGWAGSPPHSRLTKG